MDRSGSTKSSRSRNSDALLQPQEAKIYTDGRRSPRSNTHRSTEKDVQRSTVSPRWKAKELTAPTILPQNVLLDWEAGYPAQHDEAKYELAEIEGSVPMLLRNGTLFRNGPGKFELGGKQYAHRLDGDGYVVSFAFNLDGTVHFTGRFVETREKMQEDKAKKILFRSAFGTQKSGWLRNAFDMRLKNPANTNAVIWGGRLLALWEAGSPFRLDPSTLETQWEHETLGGWISTGIAPTSTGIPALDRVMRYGDACTAHPHIVPATSSAVGGSGEDRLVIWTWRSVINAATLGSSVRMKIVEFDDQWRITSSRGMSMDDGLLNCHDFSVSNSSYIFFQSATHFEMANYVLGLKSSAQCMSLVERDTKIYVASRSDPSHQMVLTKPGIMLHHANAYDDGDLVVVWSSGAGPDAMQKLREGKNSMGNMKLNSFGDFSAMPYTSLWQHSINTKTGEVVMEALHDGYSLDFPCVNPRFYSRKARHVFFTAATQEKFTSAPLQAFARLDTVSKELQYWDAGPRGFCGELVFVPGEEEDQECSGSFLLGMVFYADLQRSALVVMDASDFNKGPVTRIWTKQPLAHGLHGTFTPHYFGSKAPATICPAFEPEGPVDNFSAGGKYDENPDLLLSHADASEPEGGPMPGSKI